MDELIRNESWKAFIGPGLPESERPAPPPLTYEAILEVARKMKEISPPSMSAFINKDDASAIEKTIGFHLDPDQSPAGCFLGTNIHISPLIEPGKALLFDRIILNDFIIQPRKAEIFINDEARENPFKLDNITFKIRHEFDMFRPDNLRLISAACLIDTGYESPQERKKRLIREQRERQKLTRKRLRKIYKKRRRITEMVVRDPEWYEWRFVLYRDRKGHKSSHPPGGWKARAKARKVRE